MTDPIPSGEWPNRGKELVVTASIMVAISTLITIWRVTVRFRLAPWLSVSDWLMTGGVVHDNLALTQNLADKVPPDSQLPRLRVCHSGCERWPGPADGRSVVVSKTP